MSAEQNKATIGRAFAEAINQRNFAVVNDSISPEFTHHTLPPDGPKGPEAMKLVIQQFFDAFPDMKVTVEHIIAEGDIVATRGHWTGTNDGSFMGMPATGRSVRADYCDFWKFRDGKAVENWVQMDMIGVMIQLGLMPAPGAQETAKAEGAEAIGI